MQLVYLCLSVLTSQHVEINPDYFQPISKGGSSHSTRKPFTRRPSLQMEKYLFKDDSENESNSIVRLLVDDILNSLLVDDICEDEEEKEELNFFDISKLDVYEESSSELQSSNSSSSEIGRVYRVNDDDFNRDDDDDTDDQDIFYSTDDLMLKFIELEDQINESKIIENEEASPDLVNSDTNEIQVKKHLLKFELSKQLFEEPVRDDVTFGEQCLDTKRDGKRKMNKELLSKLFDYEQNQVENIASGESRASETLKKRSLLQVEQDLCAKKSRFSSYDYEDICFRPNPRSTLVRSSSQPNFESITEEEVISSGDYSEDSGKLRPIIASSHAPQVGVSSASQTDITALASPVKMPKNVQNRSPASSSQNRIMDHKKKGFLSRAHSIDFERNVSDVSDVQRSSASLDKSSSKSVTFLFNDNNIENTKIDKR